MQVSLQPSDLVLNVALHPAGTNHRSHRSKHNHPEGCAQKGDRSELRDIKWRAHKLGNAPKPLNTAFLKTAPIGTALAAASVAAIRNHGAGRRAPNGILFG